MRIPFLNNPNPQGVALTERPRVTVSELIDTYDIVDVKPTHLVAAPKQLSEPVDLREIGRTGTTSYGSFNSGEYNPLLMGLQGMQTYDKMRKGDAQIKSTLRSVKTPIQAARWYVEPAGDRPIDRMRAKYIEDCLFKWMSTSWPQLLQEALLMLDFGYYAFEKVFAYNTEPGLEDKLIWKKLAPRHPLRIVDWDYDANGGPEAIKFMNSDIQFNTEVTIPIDKLLVFTFDKEGGNMHGTSMLRSAYKHWYYKENLYKVDAIQKERHGIGIPIIKLPANFSPDDRKIADEIGRNLRTNEKAHIVLPPMWDILFADLKGQPVDCMVSIEHHDTMIARNVIGDFLDNNGKNDQQDLFIKSTRYIADIIRDVFNKYAIPELVNLNWAGVTDYPELRVRRIGESQDWRTFSFALRNMAGAGFVTPDLKLENWIREEFDLPKFDKETARKIATPQQAGQPDPNSTNDPNATAAPKDNPNKMDLPRQSTAPGMKQQAQGAGKSNTGQDNSGGN